jgi:hypothetical protein
LYITDSGNERVRMVNTTGIITTIAGNGVPGGSGDGGPPSPEKERVPLPATVVMMPPADTLRILELPPSAM